MIAIVRNMVTFFAAAALLMTVAKATSYTVGDDYGWTVGADYTAWLSGKTFKVGDELVFTYLISHDVLEVKKSDYETCTSSSPISKDSSGSTTISLTAVGKRYFICGTPGHCDQGQKLEVRVLGSSSSPPPPVATSPPPSPPVAKAISYTVGDDYGWTVGADYTAWLSGKTFKVGDELVFTYLISHDVLEVKKSDYETCTSSSPISKDSSGSTTISLTAVGKRYFICGTPGHCDQGQKLEVRVLGSSSSPPPPVATSPPPSPPVAKATSYTVGDDYGWTVGADYTAWLSGKTFKVGDELVFIYLISHDVLEVKKTDYETCTSSSPINKDSSGSTTISLTAVGKRYFICGTPGHCDQGQKLEVRVLGSSSSPPPPFANSRPPPQSPPPPVATPPPPPPPSLAYKIGYGASFAFALMMLAAV